MFYLHPKDNTYIRETLLFPLNVAVITDRRQEAGNRRQEYRFSPASCFLFPVSFQL